jgi:hypothetical protein
MTHANDIMGLAQQLRITATKYALLFSAQQYTHEIKPKDLTSIIEKQDTKMINSLTEGLYGNSRSSYLKLENAKMIIRHSKKVNDNIIGARGRCVETIFIENSAGERLLFPSKKLAPARAMTQHINQGGKFGDNLGKQIIMMSEDYENLSQVSKYVDNNSSLNEGAFKVREACCGKMKNLRKCFQKLSKEKTYAKECADLLKKSKMINETDDIIDETRLSELRQLLNGADFSKKVYESACKALKEMREMPITESEDDDYVPYNSTVTVMGYRIDRDAWEKFKEGKIELKFSPTFKDSKNKSANPIFNSRYAEFCYKFGELISSIKDDSLARFLQYVADNLSGYHNELKKSQAIKIANHVLNAVNMSIPESKVIKEYMEWLEQFRPERILKENMASDPYSMVGGQDFGDFYNNTLDDVVSNFDANEFVDSPEMQDVIDNRNPSDPEENTITHDELMSALKSYLERQIQLYSDDVDYNFNDDTTDLANEVYDLACEAVQKKGFIVEQNHNI